MRKLLLCLLTIVGTVAYAQTCIVPAPAKPPLPSDLLISIPVDGGTTGCTARAPVRNGAPANEYAISAAKCAQAVAIAKQAAANDNGWNDGGVP